MALTQQELRDLTNALDVLRSSYADIEFVDALLREYAPGTEAFDRTLKLYAKLTEMVQS